MSRVHLHEELALSGDRVEVQTRHGPIKGGLAANGAAVFLGACIVSNATLKPRALSASDVLRWRGSSFIEVPYALPPVRFQDPEPLPPDYRYESKDYSVVYLTVTFNEVDCAQPKNDGQAAGSPFEDKVGLGRVSENPLFVNIVSPSRVSSDSKFPVKVYIHGGFLQYGSPHGLSGQAQYVAAGRSEVWVNIGYRLSVLGFLACDQPPVSGNFGFKDQWLALLWIRDNIEAFGGDPKNIQVSGLSAGAHSVHQLLHHVSRMPEGVDSPFQSAVLQSNAIMLNPKTPTELRSQFRALCEALRLDPDASDVLATLRDPSKVTTSALLHVIETEEVGVLNSTFRGCLDGSWLATSPDPMTWQRTGGFARALRAKGVRSIVVGELTEEWYLYAIAHPVKDLTDAIGNMGRYYPMEVVEKLLAFYDKPSEDASANDAKRFMGLVLSDGQVYLPVRLLARDLAAAGFPVLRYQIRWTPEQVRPPRGYVTHGTDRSLWTLRLPSLDESQADVARAWLDSIVEETKVVETQGNTRGLHEVLALNEDRTIGWRADDRWDELIRLRVALPGEV
ncbi:uncharacterized protein FIBRA_08262 [Fibroporia radiculosa]|uniref:Carboxylic ester hydrolase n=1 Tax=Fibroporia radiculosa TaxID=599839 RepID=J4GGY6_9APHY|nr:uncharacterized protein FIBRA_08262 [Fibroporia radiculosa]CCM06018.1 predicted protein [Fibroporia radiculosa]